MATTNSRGPAAVLVELGDLEQVDRVVGHDRVGRDVALDDDAVVGGLNFYACPAIEVGFVVLLEPLFGVLGLDPLGLVPDGLDVFLGNAPGPQRADGPIEGVDVPLDRFLLLPKHDVRNDGRFGLPSLENLAVELELIDGVDQIVFLVADVDAVKGGQQVALGHLVAGTQLAAGCGCRARFQPVLFDRADLDDLGRRRRGGEQSSNRDQPRRVEHRGARHRQRPRSRRPDGRDDLVDVVLANPEGRAHVLGNKERMGLPLHKLDTQAGLFGDSGL